MKRSRQRPDSWRHATLIFLTGGAILALQLLASRVLTPYFGVSLYIWTGILSITLLCLALGYYLGGRATRLKQVRSDAARIESLFLLMPATSSIALALACLIYPQSFQRLAEAGLVVGSFLACAILLGVPLVAMSAMNPLLVALKQVGASESGQAGDSGSGWVFFVSTMGSVVGVLVAAFALIPNLTNFRGIALLGGAIGGGALLATLASELLSRTAKWRLLAVSLIGGLLCSALFLLAESYLNRIAVVRREATESSWYPRANWMLVAEYPSSFGNLKVVDVQGAANSEETLRVLLNDGINQNTTRRDGTSLALFSYSLVKLGSAFGSEARTALVLGLGAGVVPMSLWHRGLSVDVAEINPRMLTVAERYFHFRSEAATVYLQDARTFVKHCPRSYDLVFVDLYLGDSVPDHAVTREFFSDLDRCIAEKGVVAFNGFIDQEHPEPFERILATIRATFHNVILFEEPSGTRLPFHNGTVVATQTAPQLQPNFDLSDVPPTLRENLKAALENGREIGVSRQEPITDESNTFLVTNARSQMSVRKLLVRQLRAAYLVN